MIRRAALLGLALTACNVAAVVTCAACGLSGVPAARKKSPEPNEI